MLNWKVSSLRKLLKQSEGAPQGPPFAKILHNWKLRADLKFEAQTVNELPLWTTPISQNLTQCTDVFAQKKLQNKHKTIRLQMPETVANSARHMPPDPLNPLHCRIDFLLLRVLPFGFISTPLPTPSGGPLGPLFYLISDQNDPTSVPLALQAPFVFPNGWSPRICSE